MPSGARAIALIVRSRRREVILERDVGRGEELEAAIAAPVLALGARERVLVARVGMQEHREVLADRRVARREHDLRRRADDDPVAVADGASEQLVAHRAADAVDAHGLRQRPRHRPPCARKASKRLCCARGARYSGAIASSAAGAMPKRSRKRTVADAVDLHRREVVARQQRPGQPLHHPRLQRRQRRAERQRPAADGRSARAT